MAGRSHRGARSPPSRRPHQTPEDRQAAPGKGLPTDFRYTIFFYGPYSEGLHADIGLLDQLCLVHEEKVDREANTYYILKAEKEADLPEIEPFRPLIKRMNDADPVVLELAATYDAFREMGSDHADAIERLRRKKGSKCDGGNEEAALQLLRDLGLPTEEQTDAKELPASTRS